MKFIVKVTRIVPQVVEIVVDIPDEIPCPKAKYMAQSQGLEKAKNIDFTDKNCFTEQVAEFKVNKIKEIS